MTTITRKLLMTAAAVATLAAPLALQAQEAAPATAPVQQPIIPAPAEVLRTEAASPEHDGMALRLAGELSAAEIFLGITVEQETAWRAYTSAVLALAEPPAQPAPAMADQPGAPGEPGAAPDAGTTSLLMSERLAQHMLAKAEQAQALLGATEGLRGALTPEQMAKLARIEPHLAPGPRSPRGMHDGDRLHDRPDNQGPRLNHGGSDQGPGGPGWKPGQGSPKAHHGSAPDGRGSQSGPRPGPQHDQLPPPPGVQPPRN